MTSIALDEKVTRLDLGMDELKASQERVWRLFEKSVIEADRRWQEFDRYRKELEAERAQRNAEQAKLDAERKAEADRRKQELDEVIRKMSERVDRVSANLGRLGGRLGDVIELVLIPGICPAMNKHGHDFDRIAPNMALRKNGKDYVQADLLLYNTTEVMAVEIKTRLDAEDVEEHIKRLRKLRAIEDKLDITGRTLYGAVAGIVIDEQARKNALQAGLYVIEMQEYEERLKVEPPEIGKIGKW